MASRTARDQSEHGDAIGMRWVLVLLCFIQAIGLNAKSTSIHVQEDRDYEVLDLFFKMGIFEEEYGYVLEGTKPVSSRQFYPLDTFPMKDLQFSEREFQKTLLVREAIKIWNKLCSEQDRFVLKSVPVIGYEAGACGYEVQFINLSKLREVIAENIHLFRYALGPGVEVDELVNRLAYSNERFTDVLRDDLTLIGIVLGFGTHNSVVGGRLETIDRLSISKDSAPFLPKSMLLQGEDSQWMYGMYYLEYAGGKDVFFKQSPGHAIATFGFSSIQEEFDALQSKIEPLPITLQEQPRFVFNAFKSDNSNRSLFRTLKKTQKRVKSLFRGDRCTDKILEKIGGQKPQVDCDRPSEQRSVLLLNHMKIEWPCILEGVSRRFTDSQDQRAFRRALEESVSSPIPPPMMSASREMLRGLQRARDHLTAAENRCEALSKDLTLQSVIPNQLYVKTVEEGIGEPIKDVNRLRIKYVIEENSGSILFAHHDTWINLSDSILGFQHGLQGMRIGEKRTLFIHPALGYGAMTTLPPCSLLIVHVQLLDVDLTTKIVLSPINPLPLDWIQDHRVSDAIEQSLTLLPQYTGAFYGNLLKKIE